MDIQVDLMGKKLSVGFSIHLLFLPQILSQEGVKKI